MSREDSGGKHLCSEEVSRGFLRPSLEETLAFNRSRSVGEEKVVGVVGSYQVRFLVSSFSLSFVFFVLHTHLFLFFFCCRVKEFLPGLCLL